MKNSSTLIGSAFAFLLATSCCWLPWLAVAIGGAAGLSAFSPTLDKFSGFFMAIGLGLLAYFGYAHWKKQKAPPTEIVLQSVFTCPNCGHKKTETMPTDACQYFYECENCRQVAKPKPGDCCVFCSYGSVKCPPIQAGQNCC